MGHQISYFKEDQCITHEVGKNNILLIGDSHAAHWQSAMREIADSKTTISQVTSSGCKPLLPLKGETRCTALVEWANAQLIPNKKFDRIVLSGRWSHSDKKRIRDSIEFYSGFTDELWFIGPVVEYDHSLPWLIAKLGKDADLSVYSKYKERSFLDSQLREIVEGKSAKYISTLSYMCSAKGKCLQITEDGTPVQYDYGHLTHSGAKELLKAFSF